MHNIPPIPTALSPPSPRLPSPDVLSPFLSSDPGRGIAHRTAGQVHRRTVGTASVRTAPVS